MKNWKKCLEHDVKERSKNPQQAKSLLKMAKIRSKDNNRRERTEENTPLIVESHWEIIKQLTTALLKLDGYKSYSQECLITYLKEFQDFKQDELQLLNQLRKLRNDIDYDGKFLDQEYLERNQDKIKNIQNKLEAEIEKEINH